MTTIDELTPNQRRRALRLLDRAEIDDAARIAAQERESAKAERNQAIQVAAQQRADELTQRAIALGLSVTFRTQTTKWVDGVPCPEVWVAYTDRRCEQTWTSIISRLETTAPHSDQVVEAGAGTPTSAS